jgi:toxin YoeB
MVKIRKKNSILFEAAVKKIDEIIQHLDTYKPLRHDMKNFRRVHLLKSFVLVFKIDETRKTVSFEYIDHHDNIYKRK